MPVSHEGKHVDESTYWDKYYADEMFRYEWNNGYLEVLEMATMDSGFCTRWFIKILEGMLGK